jgi:hypothetical protein
MILDIGKDDEVKTRLILSFIAGVLGFVLLFGSDTALAACNPNRAHTGLNWQTGGYVWTADWADPNSPYNDYASLRADIQKYNPYVPSADGNFSLANIMLQSRSKTWYVQLGWMKGGSGSPQPSQPLLFTEYVDPNYVPHRQFYPQYNLTSNDRYELTVVDNPIGHTKTIWAYWNGINIDIFPALTWEIAQVADVFVETLYKDAQMPGGATQPVYITEIMTWKGVPYAEHDFNYDHIFEYQNSDISQYSSGFYSTDYRNFVVYDKACTGG